MPKVTSEQMAADLRQLKVDLNDERATLRALQNLGYGSGDIIVCSAEAVALAKASQKNLKSIAGDGLALFFAVGVWMAWYVVICPVQSWL